MQCTLRTIKTSALVAVLLSALGSSACMCQEDNRGIDAPAIKRWMEYYQIVAGEYQLVLDETPDATLKTSTQPIFTGIHLSSAYKSHYATYVWTHKQRPYVVGSIWSQLEPGRRIRTLCLETHSLAESGITGTWRDEVTWNPKKSGLESLVLPKQPNPAASHKLRVSQMKILAKQFSGTTHHYGQQEKRLTMPPQPLYTFESPDHGVQSGALFCLFEDRDPEIFLLIEIHKDGKGNLSWKYMPIPFSEALLTLDFSGEQVWTDPPRPYKDSTRAFYCARPLQHDPSLKDVKLPSDEEKGAR